MYKHLSFFKKNASICTLCFDCKVYSTTLRFLWRHNPRKRILLLHKSHLTHTMISLWDWTKQMDTVNNNSSFLTEGVALSSVWRCAFFLTKHCTSPQTRPSNNECCLQKERDRQSGIWESVADWAANILLRISRFCSARIQKWGDLEGSFVSDGSQSFYKYTLYRERGLWYKQ